MDPARVEPHKGRNKKLYDKQVVPFHRVCRVVSVAYEQGFPYAVFRQNVGGVARASKTASKQG
jgi:hypothetical protein